MVKSIQVEPKQNVKGWQYMPAVTKANKPNIAVEVFLSLVKWFLIFIIANNLIWAGIFTYYLNKSVTDSNIEMTQDGQQNNQSITNG